VLAAGDAKAIGHAMRPIRTTVASVLLGIALSACADPTAPGYRIVTSGYVERGSTLSLSLLANGSPVPTSEVVWTATPAGTVTLLPGPIAKLTDTGAATISARMGPHTTMLVLHIAVPPTIVFDLQDSGGAGNRDVYRMTLDGAELTRLSSGTGDNEEATATADEVIFTSYRDGYAALYAVAPTGGTETRLSAAPVPASQPALSPDGTRLAFISPSGGFDRLWTSVSDGSQAAVVVGSEAFNSALQANPAWSPAGDTLAVMSTQFGNPALVRIAPGGGIEVPLTLDTATDLSPVWSPDGQTIAFASTRDGGLGVFLLAVLNGAVAPVTPAAGADGEPAWLSDGRIVYTSNLSGATQLRWMDPIGSDSAHVIPTPAGGDPHRASELPVPQR
jgi:Tol biopolymer transport system component